MSDPFAIPNDKPIEHRCHNGNVFMCRRADLKEKVVVVTHKLTTDVISATNICHRTDELIKDVAEFIGWHALVVWPELNGFSGYDTIHFEYV